MPEVYTLRAPENFNYTNAHRSSPARIKNNRQPEKHYQKSNDRQRTPTYDLLKPPSSHIPHSTKRKTPEYNPRSPSTNGIRQKVKASDLRTHSSNSSHKKVTTYTVAASNEGHFLPYISRTLSPPLHVNKKKQLVTFDTIAHQNEYELRRPPIEIRYVPLLHSKATESIDRSMNLYRFRRS